MLGCAAARDARSVSPEEEALIESMKRTVLVLSLLVLSMGASTWLLNTIEQRTSALPQQLEVPHTLAVVRLSVVTDPVR